MLPIENQAAVNLVGEHHDVAIADGIGDVVDVALAENAAGGVLRRVDDDQLGAIGDEGSQFFHVQAEIALLAQADRDRKAADVVDHRLVDGEARVGVDNLIAFINQ